MRYVIARYKRDQRELAYRNYISEGIRMMSENTAQINGGTYLTQRYLDIIHPELANDLSANDIVKDVVSRAGLEVIG